MKFLEYIKGQRKGKDAHRIEKDSMTDPFLYEAIEGFDSINDNHFKRIGSIQKRISNNSATKKKSRQLWQSVAAVAIILIVAGTFFLSDFHKSGLYAQQAQNNIVLDVYVPQTYYEENIVPIAKNNAIVNKKAYKPQISKFKANVKLNPTISKEEINSLTSREQEESTEHIVLEIYTPENDVK